MVARLSLSLLGHWRRSDKQAPELPTVLLFAGLSCIFSDCSALSCIFSLRPAFFSHLKNGLFVKSLQLVTRLMV